MLSNMITISKQPSPREIVRTLAGRPLSVRVLEHLLDAQTPVHLQGIADALDVGKVSVHRVMGDLTTLDLVTESRGEDARLRFYSLVEKRRVKELLERLWRVEGSKYAQMELESRVTSALSSHFQVSTRWKGSPNPPNHLVLRKDPVAIDVEIRFFLERIYEFMLRQKVFESAGRSVIMDGTGVPHTGHVLLIFSAKLPSSQLKDFLNRAEDSMKLAESPTKYIWILTDFSGTLEDSISKAQFVEPIIKFAEELKA